MSMVGFVIFYALELYNIMVIAYVILIWAMHFKVILPSNEYVARIWPFFQKTVEPIIERIRILLPPAMVFDIAPIVLILAILLIQVIIKLLFL